MTKVSSFAGMDQKFLECRVLRHAWEHVITTVQREGRTDMVVLNFSCMRCGAEREDVRRLRDREMQGRIYRHPMGYVVTELKSAWGGRAVFNDNVLEELISRYLKKRMYLIKSAGKERSGDLGAKRDVPVRGKRMHKSGRKT